MPRRPRSQPAGSIQHITARGAARGAIFHDDDDRRYDDYAAPQEKAPREEGPPGRGPGPDGQRAWSVLSVLTADVWSAKDGKHLLGPNQFEKGWNQVVGMALAEFDQLPEPVS